MATAAANASEGALTVIEDATCTFCGCVCDDIDLSIKNDRIIDARRACLVGKRWLLDYPADRPSCLIEGRSASVGEGVERAARLLVDATYPFIYGLSDTTSEAQRVAVALCDAIDGTIDTPTSTCNGPLVTAFQNVGQVTCTLGEVANRGDLIVFWGGNPAESHPRLFTKYSLMPKGQFIPNGRKDRTAIGVGVQRTKTAKAMDVLLRLKPQSDFEALSALRALAKGVELDPDRVKEDTGIELIRWQDLLRRMKAANFGVIVFGTDLETTRGGHLTGEALLSLARDMNAYTRFVVMPMGGPGNVAGADNCLSSSTGYPFGVNMSRGYPRFNPGEYTTSAMLARGEADAGLVVACDPMAHFSRAARQRLEAIPYIALDPNETETTRSATVVFTTATYGINVPGTVYRMDGVPIGLRPAFDSPRPSDFDVLSAIARRVRELKP